MDDALRSRAQVVLGELRGVLDALDAARVDEIAREVVEARRVFLAGAGRSGLAMRMLAVRLAQAGLAVHVAADPTAPACGDGDLVLVGSGSGRTATVRALADRAREAGARVGVVTRAPRGPLARVADLVLHIPVPEDASRPGGLASTQPLGTLFEQALLLVADLLVERILARKGLSAHDLQARHANLE